MKVKAIMNGSRVIKEALDAFEELDYLRDLQRQPANHPRQQKIDRCVMMLLSSRSKQVISDYFFASGLDGSGGCW